MWQGSAKKNPYGELPPPETCSWLVVIPTTGNALNEVQSRVTDTINFLTKGCSCKKGFHNNLAISVGVETAVDQDITVKGVLMLVEYASHISQSEIETDSA